MKFCVFKLLIISVCLGIILRNVPFIWAYELWTFFTETINKCKIFSLLFGEKKYLNWLKINWNQTDFNCSKNVDNHNYILVVNIPISIIFIIIDNSEIQIGIASYRSNIIGLHVRYTMIIFIK